MTAPDSSKCRIPRLNSATPPPRLAIMYRHSAPTTRMYFPAFWGIPKIASQRSTSSGFFTTQAAQPDASGEIEKRAAVGSEDRRVAQILGVGMHHYPPLGGRDEAKV